MFAQFFLRLQSISKNAATGQAFGDERLGMLVFE